MVGGGARGAAPWGRGDAALLRLLLGRAGTGKTETCLREALEALAREGPDGPPLVLLAPEQSTFQLERALLSRLPAGAAVSRLQVLSFRRLAALVLAEAGAPGGARLGAAGRRMALRAALGALRPALEVFGASVERPGFAGAALAQIDELAAWQLTPAALGELAQRAPGATAARLRDLARLWAALASRLGGHAGEPDADLAAAAAALATSSLAHATCWVDGFSGFTGREEAVLAAWLACGAEITVALLLDPDDDPSRGPALDPMDPFAPTRATARRLVALARRAGSPPPRLQRLRPTPPPRFAHNPALAALEQGLWQGSAGGAPAPAAVGAAPGGTGVWLYAARDPVDEAEACGAEIDRLCRLEGFRYREIGVVVHDLDTYQAPLTIACARRGVPLFVDRLRAAARHPVAHALLAGLEVVASDWSTAAVRRYLQGELTGLEREEADALDLFAAARGAFGADWYGAGPAGGAARPGAGDGRHRLPRADETARRRLVRPLRALQRALAASPTAAEAARACFRFLEDLEAPRHVLRWIREAEAEGAFDRAAWQRQCWEAVVATLDDAALALGGEPVTPAGLAVALRAALEDLTVGLVPPGLDQVVCGGGLRSRHPDVRVAFVLGVGDGLFPPPVSEAPLLGDAERLVLRRLGADLGPTAAEAWMHERFLAYVALTRAADRLYLSYPLPVGPSDVLLRVRAAVPTLGAWGPPAGPDARAGVEALASEVARRRGGAPSPAWRAAEGWLQAEPQRRRRAQALWRALSPAPPELPRTLAVRLYPRAMSPTRLETMGACPFQHFARYGLRLQERREAGVDPGDLGTLLHAALATVVRGLIADGRDWSQLAADEAARRCDAALQREAAGLLARLPRGNARGRHLLAAARRDLGRAVATMVAHARAGAGRYQPVGVEVPLAGELQGAIDRVDEARDDAGRLHVRVVDYKTGSATFRLEAFVDGVDLAPVLYLAAALAARGDGARPGGVFTFSVRDDLALVPGPGHDPGPPPRLRGLAPAEAEARSLHEQALDGTVTGVRTRRDGQPAAGAPVADAQAFGLLLRAAERRRLQLRAAMEAGEIAPLPFRTATARACDTCPLPAVCRFDPRRGDGYRWGGRGDPWRRLWSEESAGQRGDEPGGAEAPA
jgi:ATP-dependent helicase/nuclease subunit B